MANTPAFNRPAFEEALKEWKALLKARGLPPDCQWVFYENLCFEPDPAKAGQVRLSYQVAFTPPPPDAEGITYDSFAQTDARLVFYRLGSWDGKSICVLLCDPFFENRGEADGFVRHDNWGISFRPGHVEEVIPLLNELPRYKRRLLRNRPRHDVDFCMSLRGVHEIMAHGQVLSTYERYSVRFFHIWWRMLGKKA